ncbi:CvpA family protein [Desulfogranum mediterraneum]|uniref:CvpA family protein n=1 Tax=Desulfogranum mediterraneum TaxID=160661 RepID=UPI001376F6EE|nr:CvpA family protein [Desulfogranum mediterraneum]
MFAEFSLFDIFVVLILLFFLIRGLWIGCVRQLAAFFALVGGYWLAARYHGELAPLVDHFLDEPKLIFLVSVIALFMVAVLVFTLLGKLLHKVVQITLMGWFDRLLGGGLGVLKGLVISSLLYMFLASSLSASNSLLGRSFTVPYLQLGAAQLQRLINDPRLRDYFNPKKPAIGSQEKARSKSSSPGKN